MQKNVYLAWITLNIRKNEYFENSFKIIINLTNYFFKILFFLKNFFKILKFWVIKKCMIFFVD